MWSNACGSTDVKTMMQQPAALLQALQQKHVATAVAYLKDVRAVLRVPAVAAAAGGCAGGQQVTQLVQDTAFAHSSHTSHSAVLLKR
jgi:hypothetical protein